MSLQVTEYNCPLYSNSLVLCPPSRTRTYDPLLKRQVLYQLSYGRVVPRVGLEPTRTCVPKILSLVRLPISPPRLEAWAGIEPACRGFANRCLTTWLPGLIYLKVYQFAVCFFLPYQFQNRMSGFFLSAFSPAHIS